jgi:hypothetical protein
MIFLRNVILFLFTITITTAQLSTLSTVSFAVFVGREKIPLESIFNLKKCFFLLSLFLSLVFEARRIRKTEKC